MRGNAHVHPDYPTLYRPARNEVPDALYADYVYAVKELKKTDAKVNGFG